MACLWPQLPAHLEAHIFSFLPPNDLASTVPLINKAAAASYGSPQYRVTRLSQPVPLHALVHDWGPNSASLRILTLKKRLQLLWLTATSGSLVNLAVVWESAGCVPSSSIPPTLEVMAAAAAAGHLHVCLWLRQQGCPFGSALSAAAHAGLWEVCQSLLSNGCGGIPEAVCSAVRGGQVSLMETLLLQQLPDPVSVVGAKELLAAAAESCDLATLQRLHGTWLRAQPEQQGEGAQGQQQHQQQQQLTNSGKEAVMAAAARSPTPDWQAKVEWLEGQGYPQTGAACEEAAALRDAVDRLRWLRQRGYPLGEDASFAVGVAARTGNMAALEYLLGEAGVRVRSGEPAVAAAGEGQLAALQFLHARGCRFQARRAATAAAEGGHLAVVAWLVETLGLALADMGAGLIDGAAVSGNMELLAWLYDRGSRWDHETLPAVATGGCEAALEWLVERGCPLPANGMAYRSPACNGDLATLRCLRRLGCPWGSTNLFTMCVATAAPLSALQWFMQEGCPVDWDRALWSVPYRPPGDQEPVAAWLREEQRAWQEAWRRRAQQ